MEAVSFDTQRSINMYALMSESGTSKSVSALRSTAGYELFATVGDGPIRWSISSTSGRAFVVSGDGFYELFEDGTSTLRGTINTQTGIVSISENFTQVMIVDGTDGWIFNKDTNVFVQITSVNFPPCSVVSFQDGYFMVTEKDTQKFFISNLNNGLLWDALDFTSVESSPDNLISVISDNGNVWLLGNRSVEAYQNTGNAAFPFERISGAIIQTGCAAAFTVAKFDNTIVWLGIDEQGQGTVWIADGYLARRISTQAIERKITSVADFTDAVAWVYHERGHIFYMLQITGLDTTLCYDGTTGQWHERMFKDPITNERQLHRGITHMFFDQKNLIGDRLTGNIYNLDLEFNDDNGDEQIRERISPHYANEKMLVSYGSFEIDTETGVGITTGQGSNPQIMMQYSDDGGRTWSSEIWRDLGAKGKYQTRVIWRRLGSSRDRVFKVRVSDPVFVQFNEATINAT